MRPVRPCLHCPHCHDCFAGRKEYIEHFRVDGRLVFTSCPDIEAKLATEDWLKGQLAPLVKEELKEKNGN